MKRICVLPLLATIATPAFAADALSTLPPDSMTVTNYYKQDVYDKSQNSIGKIDEYM